MAKMFKVVLKYLIFARVQSFFDLITPKTVPDKVKLFSRGINKMNTFVFNSSSRATAPWATYVDGNLKHAIKSCFISRKKGHYLLQMRKCLMDCSPSCQVMNRYFAHKCIALRVGMANKEYIINLVRQSHRNPSLTTTDIFQRHLVNPDICPFTYNDHAFFMYQKYLGLYFVQFLTDIHLRINVTFLHFDILQKKDCVVFCAGRERFADLAYVHLINSRNSFKLRYVQGYGMDFKVGTFKIAYKFYLLVEF